MAVGDSFRTEPQVIPGPGVPIQASVGTKGEILIGATRPRFYDQNYNGRLFHGGVGLSATAGVSLNGAATLAQTCAIAIYNPIGSKVNASITRAVWQYLSGTIGLSNLFWAYASGVAAGTLGQVVSGQLVVNGGNKCFVYTGATTFASTATSIRPSGISLSAWVGTATTPIPPPVQEIVEGDLLVPPGYVLGLVAIGAAGTTDKSFLSLSWTEDPA